MSSREGTPKEDELFLPSATTTADSGKDKFQYQEQVEGEPVDWSRLSPSQLSFANTLLPPTLKNKGVLYWGPHVGPPGSHQPYNNMVVSPPIQHNRNAEHTKWEPIFAHTAKCDSCDTNKHDVLQRCATCNHQLCRSCMMSKKWKKSHDADFTELVWSQSYSETSAKKGRGRNGPGSIKKKNTSSPSLGIGAGTKSAPGSSKVSKPSLNQQARLKGQRLMTEEEKYRPQTGSYSSRLSNEYYRPANSSPLSNEISYDRNLSDSPLAAKHPVPTRSAEQAGTEAPDYSGLFSDLEDEDEEPATSKAIRKPVRKVTKPRAAKTKRAPSVPTPSRRQPLRTKNSPGGPASAPNYREDGGDDDDEEGTDPRDTLFEDPFAIASSPYSKTGQPSSGTRRRPGRSPGVYLSAQKSATPQEFEDDLDKNNPFVKQASPYTRMPSINAQVAKYRLRDDFHGPRSVYSQGNATASTVGSAFEQRLDQAGLGDTTESETGSAHSNATVSQGHVDFSAILAQVVKDRERKAKIAEYDAQMAALDLECTEYWNTHKMLVRLRNEGKENEAHELLDAAKSLMALQRGICLPDN